MEELLIHKLSPPDLQADEPVLRFREEGNAFVLETLDIEWEGGPHSPVPVWKERTRWTGRPGMDELRRAIETTYQSPECFAVCEGCAREGRKARIVVGHSFDGTTCQDCASKHMGVVY